jgi:hypothetical protein
MAAVVVFGEEVLDYSISPNADLSFGTTDIPLSSTQPPRKNWIQSMQYILSNSYLFQFK